MQNKGSANASVQSLQKKPQPEQTFLLEQFPDQDAGSTDLPEIRKKTDVEMAKDG